MPNGTGEGTRALGAEQLRLARVRAQGLAPRRGARDGVAVVVAGAGGLQAQQWPAARLSVRARSASLRAEDVERAREVERSVVRGWFMRGTLHLVATEDAAWLLDLYAPVLTAGWERRYGQLGLDQATRDRGVELIRATVERDGPRTRAELVESLLRVGVPIDPRSQAVPYLIADACLRGVVCHGPHRGDEPAFALRSEWVGSQRRMDPDTAVDELARRHLAAFGPATLADFATWSGLPRRRVRAAWQRIGGELTEIRGAGTSMWLLRRQVGRLEDMDAAAGAVRLLPAFDSYLLGYETRALTVEDAHAKRVWPGGGILHPTVIADGRAVATWRYDTGRATPRVRVTPFTPGALPHAPLEEEVADVGRFLGVDPKLVLE